MEKYLYIKKSIAKHFIDFANPLSAEEYNNIGETWEDYMNNEWVLLSEEQKEFYAEHEGATPKEVWDMEITPKPERTLEVAKYEKIQKIRRYDSSEAVNSFTIGNKSMWLDSTTRQQLKASIDAYKDMGKSTVTKWFDGIEYTFSVNQWYQMLAALEVYAGDALNVTESHKAAVNALESIQEVDNYDYTVGYPEKISFNTEQKEV